MSALKPYLIRAVYEWIVDNEFSPYLLVDAADEDAELPRQYVQDGKIVLNVRPDAIQGLSLGNDRIAFDARFGGIAKQVEFPVSAVLAIYAKENGKGMIFEEQDNENVPPPEPQPPKEKHSKPVLKVVK